MTELSNDPVVIVGCARTPMGSFQGELAALTAPQLGAAAIKAALERAGVDPQSVDEVLMGCVLPAGQGQALARQASLGAGLPLSAGCTTVNKMCGSGMRAAMAAHDMLLAGSVETVVAGGMESMTNAPYLLPKARAGLRIGHTMMYDHMMLDGLEDAYDRLPNGGGKPMGGYGEDCADKYHFTREQQDAFASASVSRARAAAESGALQWEITPVTVPGKAGDTVIDSDEGPHRIKLENIPKLKPAFKKDGTVTAASSSSINDGAAALVMMRESAAKAKGLKPLARILGHASHAQAPGWFTTAPIGAIEKLLKKIGWKAGEVELREINEAFAVVPMAAMHDLGIAHEKVNVHGGACAVGHPIGASGARIMVTLMGALRKRGLRKGVASLCIGGGEATAIALEML
ncbi:MAG: acetyl-CoA C-acetyltransferase [Candidatus Protistobacter heckmanni]|nr:acetyl-CoA C-acetyltransferase [Candidatus Protistobacter heckmanni]